jgi:hypothetical protein
MSDLIYYYWIVFFRRISRKISILNESIIHYVRQIEPVSISHY